MERVDVLIIGSGIAAISAADAAMKQNEAQSVLVCTQEQDKPYYRLRVQERINEAAKDLNLHEDEWYDLHKISIRYDMQASKLDSDEKTVTFANGSTLAYNKLIIATGSKSFVPPIPGADGDHVHTLWTIEDADAIQAEIDEGGTAVIIGGGLLGLETAEKIKEAGEKLIVLESMDRLLSRQTDSKSSSLFKDYLEAQGIKVILNAKTTEIKDLDAKKQITLADGQTLDANFIVISTGVRPNTNWLEGSDIKIDKQICVNEKMETNVDSVYAVGDVANQNNLWFGLWSVAQKQGKTAGINASGGDTSLVLETPPYVLNTMGITLASAGQYEDRAYPHETIEIDEDNYSYKRVIYQSEDLEGPILGYILLGKNVIRDNVALYKRLVK